LKKKIRAVVFGYHNIGCECLELLLQKGVDVALVVTHRDDPRENIWFDSVFELARQRGIPVVTPESPNTESFIARIKDLRPDIIFSFYYRYMISPDILGIPPLGAFNLHGSLLPAYRGRCPVNWVLVRGEKRTGVSIHRMTEKPDRGNVVVRKAVPIKAGDTALVLFNRLTKAAVPALAEFLRLARKGRLEGMPQDQSKASYFGGRKPEDGRIDWRKGALEAYNLVRAVTHPYPGAFTTHKGKKIFVWWGKPVSGKVHALPGTVVRVGRAGVSVATGKGKFLIKKMQVEGGVEKDAAAVCVDESICCGAALGSQDKSKEMP
jgi:methionyl-tRNA formyltransferase